MKTHKEMDLFKRFKGHCLIPAFCRQDRDPSTIVKVIEIKKAHFSLRTRINTKPTSYT